MPAVVKVKVIRARDLPIMDRSSELTDAFVEMRLAQGFQKTEVCHKTLNPQWTPNWYTFTVTDEELQDEPLQLKIMDYDMYSAHDAIGRVYVTPGSLVTGSSPIPLEGWFPIFDTLHGVRGEVLVRVEVELIRDQHRFKHSSSEIKFFSGPGIPSSYIITAIPGFVEELVVNDDPEYQWIDKIRTPRTSNEARQRLFLKLSGELQRRIGVKALEAGGNAIIGYSQSFDLEGESGIVVRGIGTCVKLSSSPAHLSSPPHLGHASSQQLNSSTSSGNLNESLRNAEDSVVMTAGDGVAPPPAPPISEKVPLSLRLRKISSSESDVIPASPSKADVSALLLGTSAGSGGHTHLLQLGTYTSSEFPFYTLRSFSRGFVKSLAGVVSARSVKLLDEINNPEEPETRDAWWREVRGEIKAHFRAMGCNAVIGYSEHTSICDSLCIFSATGTAAVVATDLLESPLVTKQPVLAQAGSLSDMRVLEDERRKGEGELQREESFIQPSDDACSVCHIAYSTVKCPPDMKFLPCAVCRSKHVPSVLLSTCDIPPGLLTRGKGCLIQARVCRYKKKLKGEDNASQVSKLFPFVEFQLHSRLINKMKVKGMNAVFGLSTQVAVGDTMLVAIATGTAVFLEALPAPGRLTFTGKVDSNPQLDVQSFLDQLQESNRKQYSLFESQEAGLGGAMALGLKRADETGMMKERSRSPDAEVDGDLFGGREKTLFVDVEDQQTKVDDLSELLSDHDLPQGFHISSLPYVPGVVDGQQHCNSQMVTLLSRHIMDTKQSHLVEQQFGQLLDKALQGLLFTVRHIHPCLVTNVTFVVDLPDDDELQVFVVAMTNSLVAESLPRPEDNKVNHVQAEEQPIDQEDIFIMEGGGATGGGELQTMQTAREQFFLMSSLPYQAGYTILHHLGIINLFLIRESTSIKEFGGINSFLHTFVSEAHAMVRANVIALGGNGLLSYRLQQCIVIEHPHKNQAQCLLNVMGDAVLVSKEDEEFIGAAAQSPLFPSSAQLLDDLSEPPSLTHHRASLNTTDTHTVSIQTEQNLSTV